MYAQIVKPKESKIKTAANPHAHKKAYVTTKKEFVKHKRHQEGSVLQGYFTTKERRMEVPEALEYANWVKHNTTSVQNIEYQQYLKDPDDRGEIDAWLQNTQLNSEEELNMEEVRNYIGGSEPKEVINAHEAIDNIGNTNRLVIKSITQTADETILEICEGPKQVSSTLRDQYFSGDDNVDITVGSFVENSLPEINA